MSSYTAATPLIQSGPSWAEGLQTAILSRADSIYQLGARSIQTFSESPLVTRVSSAVAPYLVATATFLMTPPGAVALGSFIGSVVCLWTSSMTSRPWLQAILRLASTVLLIAGTAILLAALL